MNQCCDSIGTFWQIVVFVILYKLVIVFCNFFLAECRNDGGDNFLFGSVFNDDCGCVDDASFFLDDMFFELTP